MHLFIYSFIHYVSIDCYSPHHCVGLLFFAWHPPLLPHPAAPLPTSHSPLITSHSSHHNSSQHPFSHLSHHSTTYHTTCHSHIITQHSSQRYLSHHLSQQSHRGWLSGGAAACFVWQAQYIGPAGGAAARVVAAWPAAGVRVAGAIHRAFWRRCCGAWSPAGPRLAFVWQAQYTQPSGGAAARVVKSCCARGRRLASIHRAFWRRCCARGRRLARGWLSCGRRSTHSLLEELLRAWSPPGRRLAFVWQAQYTGPSGGAAARVVAGWPAAGFRVAGAVHRRAAAARMVRGWPAAGFREPSGGAAAGVVAGWPAAGFRVAGAVHTAFWRSCCARGRRLARGWLSCGKSCCARGRRLASIHRAFWRRCCARGRRLARGWLSCGRRSTQGLLEELLRAWPRLAVIWHAQYTEPPGGAGAGVAAAGPRLAVVWPAQYTEPPGGAAVTPLCHTTLSHTPSFTHHLSHHVVTHTIFHTPSLTHHLSHTIFHTPSQTIFHTPLCHTPSFTQVFQTPSFTHHFVTHHLSHTIFDTPLCHTLSLTHYLSHTTWSHTIFHHTIFVTHHLSPHHLSHTQLCHTPSFLHLLLCLSFLPRHGYNVSCSLLEEVDLWGYPVLLFFHLFIYSFDGLFMYSCIYIYSKHVYMILHVYIYTKYINTHTILFFRCADRLC